MISRSACALSPIAVAMSSCAPFRCSPMPSSIPWVDQGKIAWSSQWTIDLHPDKPDQLVSAVGRSFDRKVVRTVDAGKTWTISDDASGKYFRVLHHPRDPKLVFAGKRRSTDGGASFAPLSLPAELDDADLQVLDFCRAQPDVLYAASAKSRRILRSVDKGSSWSLYAKAGGSIAPFDSYITFAVDPARCDVIYTLDSEGDLARYDGASWTSLGVMAKVNAPDGYFTFVRAVQVDPNHPEVIYAGTFGSGLPALLRSTDGGQSWEDVSLNRFRGGVSGINISPHSGEVLVGSCSGTWVLPPAYPTNHRIYDKLVPRPSCLDGIKNGEEGGIDCGGGCPQACAGGGDGGGPGPGGDGTVAPTSDAGAGGDGGGGDGGNTDPAADGGCGCRTDGRGGTGSSLLALLALLAACSARPRPAESLTPSPTQEEGISVFFQRRKAARVRDKSATKGGTQ